MAQLMTSAEHHHHHHNRQAGLPFNASLATTRGSRARSKWWAMLFGGLSLFVCIVSFTIQTVVSRSVQDKMNYNHPYMILWISHSFWVVLLPLHYLYEKMKPNAKSTRTLKEELQLGSAKIIMQNRHRQGNYKSLRDESAVEEEADVPVSPGEFTDEDDNNNNNSVEVQDRPSDGNDAARYDQHGQPRQRRSGDRPLNVEEILIRQEDEKALKLARMMPHHVGFHMAAIVTAVAFLLNAGAYLWYAAITFTSISKITAIYNTSCFFAYLFSVLMLGDRIRFAKCLAIAISIGGVLLMTLWNASYTDGSSSSSTAPGMAADTASLAGAASGGGLTRRSVGIASTTELIGDTMSVVCAILIGLYQVIYKKYLSPPNFHSLFFVNFLTSILGLSTLVVLWLPIPILSLTGFEPFAWPTKSQLGMILINALFGVAYNGGYMIMLVLTSPLFASVGIMLTIPILSIIDMFMQGSLLSWNVLVGSAAILVGFAILTWAQYTDALRGSDIDSVKASTINNGARLDAVVAGNTAHRRPLAVRTSSYSMPTASDTTLVVNTSS